MVNFHDDDVPPMTMPGPARVPQSAVPDRKWGASQTIQERRTIITIKNKQTQFDTLSCLFTIVIVLIVIINYYYLCLFCVCVWIMDKSCNMIFCSIPVSYFFLFSLSSLLVVGCHLFAHLLVLLLVAHSPLFTGGVFRICCHGSSERTGSVVDVNGSFALRFVIYIYI